ncbi:hypothetical protein [Nocardioides sp. Leaf285]|uniref:hypothetical protein n=1 Tax=Nocardioides sp. Leaf285 TaxID=1736322 RepID=UPI000B134E53|nr:hypothetical protein [Nocardioides sp. Leaf285]
MTATTAPHRHTPAHASGTRSPGPQPRWRPSHDVFGQTYYVLRWSMPVLLVWLAVAIATAWLDSGLALPMTSISAYYYTDVHTVFVGVLIALGVLLVVIQGRTPWEDALMNTAGALAPFVALLPTPVTASDTCIAPYCTSRMLDDVIPDNHEIIAFNVLTAIPVWLILCAYLTRRAWTMRHGEPRERHSSIFSAATTTVFGAAGLLVWFDDGTRQLFYDRAHLTSAALMVTMLIASMVPFAMWMGPSTRWPFTRGPFARWPGLLGNEFWVVLWLTLLGLAACGLVYVVKDQWDHTVLVVEIAAIVPFFLYWGLQGLALGRRDRNGPPVERSA